MCQQIGATVGKGAYGMVYQGMNMETGEIVAIKQLRITNVPKDHLSSIMVRLAGRDVCWMLTVISDGDRLVEDAEASECGDVSWFREERGAFEYHPGVCGVGIAGTDCKEIWKAA